jgi:hypothetical protein
MKPEDIFSLWKQRRQDVRIPSGFSDALMRAIECQAAPVRTQEVMEWAAGHLMSGRLARLGLAAGLLSLGLFRLAFVTVSLLLP